MPTRYTSSDDDSARWLRFPFRDGDIVISTRSKSGTTWMQVICALLVFQTADLPAPLSQLSPWIDWLIRPLDEVIADLEAQDHRRFVKTHAPLDGVVLDPRASYIVVCRNPLDMAVSLYHQGNNINRVRLRELTGQPAPAGPPKPRRALKDWLLRWIDNDDAAVDNIDGLRGVMWHLSDAWSRREQNNIILVHYDDLCADLDGTMRAIASRLGIAVPPQKWPELVEAATFERMRANAERVVPDPSGVFLDRTAFFRRGRSGAGAEVLSPDELAHYYERAAAMAPADALAWLHRDGPAGEHHPALTPAYAPPPHHPRPEG